MGKKSASTASVKEQQRIATARMCGSIGGMPADLALICKCLDLLTGRASKATAESKASDQPLSDDQQAVLSLMWKDAVDLFEKAQSMQRRADALDCEINCKPLPQK